MMNRKYLFAIGLFIIISIGSIGIAGNTIYSGADEAAHFDYINFIIEKKSLPTMDEMIDYKTLNIKQANPATIPGHHQHEAVQPPLYYLLAASVGSFFDDIYIRLIMLRILGLIGLIISFFIVYKTYNLMTERKYVISNDILFFVLALLFITSPYFQRVMIPLNNEHLLLVLVSTLIYKLVEYINKDITLRQSLLIGILVGAIILTKLTAGYLAILVAGFFLFKKWYKSLFIVGGTSFILLFPWVIFNFIHYQSITGTKRHIEIVGPVINPLNDQYTIVRVIKFLPDFFTSMWFWKGIYPIERILHDFLSVMFVLALIYCLIKFKEKINSLFLLSIIGNIAILAAITISTPIVSMIGRYMYMNYLASVIVVFIFTTQVFHRKYVKWFSWIYGIAGFIFVASHVIDLITT